ncbi:MAG: hypothetical protein DRI01_06805 [Chloroflexi bacterium]|nr:MAG: hypothetical protein DRI01_06805 [Chloroflexota bacterium]
MRLLDNTSIVLGTASTPCQGRRGPGFNLAPFAFIIIRALQILCRQLERPRWILKLSSAERAVIENTCTCGGLP